MVDARRRVSVKKFADGGNRIERVAACGRMDAVRDREAGVSAMQEVSTKVI